MCAGHVRDPLGLLVLVDEYVRVVFQDRFDSLYESHAGHAWAGKGKGVLLD